MAQELKSAQRFNADMDWLVEQSIQDLRHAVEGDETFYRISCVFDRLRKLPAGVRSMPAVDRDRFLEQLQSIRKTVPQLFADACEVSLALRGIDAFAVAMIEWADPEDFRAVRFRHLRQDNVAAARIMQNLCHNESLEAELRERAQRRRRDTFAALEKIATG